MSTSRSKLQKIAAGLGLLTGLALLMAAGCPMVPGGGFNPHIDPANFVATIDNPYFPLVPGTTFTYEGQTDAGAEVNVVAVTNDTKQILGVTCVVVHDEVFTDGVLTEDTLDWYAQDKDGNVWYFGEDSKELDATGAVISTEGSWEAGVDGAKPGIVMEANPPVGDVYRQEFQKGVAEDMAEVLSLTESVTVPYGSFTDALETKDFSPLEPGVVEHKWFVAGVGFVSSTMVQGGLDTSQLVSVTTE